MTISFRTGIDADSSPALRSILREGPSSKTDEEVKRQMETSPRRVTRRLGTPLTEEQFGDLWDALEDTGIFELRESPGEAPPKDRAYFLFDDTRRRWVFPIPDTSALNRLDADQVTRIEAWRKAKQVIASGRWRRGPDGLPGKF